jgi:amidase
MSIDLCLPAHRLLAHLARREFSAQDLIQATFERMAAVNPTVNAVVAHDETRALAAARAIDRKRARGEAVGPLGGLPVTIKDAFPAAGLVTTGGAPWLSTHTPLQDAPAVARLRAAGAIIIGKSNVCLLSGDFQTFNPLHGVTRNPWDTARTPGGSSGGAVVAVATGMSALDLGSDLGGSIRWPCHATGVFGLKPTYGVVSRAGSIPPGPDIPQSDDVALTVAGPIARSARDLALALNVLACGAVPALALRLPPARRREPAGLRIALLQRHPRGPTAKAVRQGVVTAGLALAGAGAQVTEIDDLPAPLAELHRVYATLVYALVALDWPAKTRAAIAANASRFAAEDVSPDALMARGAALSFAEFLVLATVRERAKAAMAAFFADHDVLLCPPAFTTAFAHDERPFAERRVEVDGVLRPHSDFLHWSSIASLLQAPAAVAPVGLTAEGMPTGVQIVAAPYADRTAIAVAGMIERLLGGARRPPVVAAPRRG